MKRFVSCFVLTGVMISFALPSVASRQDSGASQTRAYRKAARKAQKAMQKNVRQQQKATRKSDKAQKKALKRAHEQGSWVSRAGQR